jgi:hypothetical protein
MTYENASYGTGGVGLRNRGGGVLNVSGVVRPVQDAYLYWGILFSTAQPTYPLSSVCFRQIYPNTCLFGTTLRGTLLGVGADPCWGSTGIAVYRSRVPRDLLSDNGNGSYEVVLEPGASGLTDGSDPYPPANQVFPEADGVSLVVVGTGLYTVSIYDQGFTATTFGLDSLTYTLNFPVIPQYSALWDNIGADGQTGVSRLDDSIDSAKTTTINGVLIAGAGGQDNDADWNGSAGLPIPKLWDDTGHDITSAVLYDETAEIEFVTPIDCVTTIANVLALY